MKSLSPCGVQLLVIPCGSPGNQRRISGRRKWSRVKGIWKRTPQSSSSNINGDFNKIGEWVGNHITIG